MDDGRRRAALAVAARRGDLGLTQAALAALAGVDEQTVAYLERCKRWPIAINRAKIDKALGWAPGRMAEIAASAPPQEPELLISADLRAQLLRDYPPETAKRLLGVIERTLVNVRSAGEQEEAQPPA